MARKRAKIPLLDLPSDLAAFLGAGKQLEYDPRKCEAGAVTLPHLSEVQRVRFPVETSGSPRFKEDPRYPEVNSYLVLGVDLTVGATGGYDPEGLLIWLPVEQRYGVWDSSHCSIQMFRPELTWSEIAADPAAFINAGWGGGRGKTRMEPLVPWPAHPYGTRQVYSPQPE